MERIYIDGGFPIKLRELMQEHNLTQRELAEAIGVGQTTISSWLDGDKHKTPRPERVKALAHYFGVRPEELGVGLLVPASETLCTNRQVKEIFRTLFDCYFLTLDAYDQYNDNPVAFMSALEKVLYREEVDTEEMSGKTLRAFELAKPIFEELALND